MHQHKHNILALVDFSATGQVAVNYAVKASKAFNRGLTLLYISSTTTGQASINQYRDKLCYLSDEIKTTEQINVQYILESGPIFQILSRISQTIEAAIIVYGLAPSSKFKLFHGLDFLKASRSFKMPFIVVQNQNPTNNQLETVYLPITHKKEEKEKLIWASYFGRFNQSHIILLPAKESDNTAKAQVQAHLVFAKKLFEKFALNYEIRQTSKNSFSIRKEAINIASKNNNSIVIITTTKHYGPEEEIIGPPELKIIKNRTSPGYVCQSTK